MRISTPFSDAYVPASSILLPAPLNGLYSPENEELTYTELLRICEGIDITISNADVINVEKATREQSKSAAWFNQRAGRVTASRMKAVCSTDPAYPSQCLIMQICYPQQTKFTSTATTWDASMKLQLKLHICKGSNDSFSCCDSGLMISSSHPFLAATPDHADGIVDCTCCGMGILEIKCPYCIRQDDPGTAPCFEGDMLKKIICTITKCNHSYLHVVQSVYI